MNRTTSRGPATVLSVTDLEERATPASLTMNAFTEFDAEVRSVEASHGRLNDSHHGETFQVAIHYKELGNLRDPQVRFDDALGGTLTPAGGNWEGDSYYASFLVQDSGVKLDRVDLRVADESGSHFTAGNLFEVDMTRRLEEPGGGGEGEDAGERPTPGIRSVWASHGRIGREDAGGTFALTVEYGEAPGEVELDIRLSDWLGETLAFGYGEWDGASYTAFYTILDEGVSSEEGVDVRVSAGEQSSFTAVGLFLVEMAPGQEDEPAQQDPPEQLEVARVSASHGRVRGGQAGERFAVSVEFKEAPGGEPELRFSEPLLGTLVFSHSEWDGQRYTGYYTIVDSGESADSVDVWVEGRSGGSFVARNLFEVDMA